jgi:hypothetical protein
VRTLALTRADGCSPCRPQVESICRHHLPELSKKIVTVVERRVLRQSPKSEAFLL